MIKAMKTIAIVALTLYTIAVIWTMPANGTLVPTITVDGVVYDATKVSGPVIHFETPDSDPLVAFTARHTWTSHGSENLPCEEGIHWIDNTNVLTVSNCLEDTTTTTTTTVSSTTTLVTENTTPSTTSTTPTSPPATTIPQETTTVPESFTTTPVAPPVLTTLPETGMIANASILAFASVFLLAIGILFVKGYHE